MASLQLTAVRAGLLLLCQKAHFDKVWASSEETLQPGGSTDGASGVSGSAFDFYSLPGSLFFGGF